MDLTPERLAAPLLLAAGFLARWVWERLWRKKDAATADAKAAASAAEKARENRMDAVEIAVTAIERRVGDAEAREKATGTHIGLLEANQNRLDGKVDGLQKHWTSRFDKLEDEMQEGFKLVNAKLDYRLDNLRMELRGDQQAAEDRLLKLLEGHRQGVHNRLNILAKEQADGLNQLLDDLVERIAEPRPSPARPPGV